MAQVIEIDELDAGACLATFGHLRATREAAERDILLLCVHFADLHNVDSHAGDAVPRRGAERPVRLGGEGTPVVWEFAVAEVAAELSTTTWSTRRLMADALDVRHRLPELWRGLDTGAVLAGLARKVAQATRELTTGQAAMVDEQMVGYADGRLPFSRFMSRLEGLVVAADPVAAAARERRAREEEFAKVGQSNDHGQKTLYVRTGAAQMARIDATIAFYADVLASLGDTDPLDKRRSKAVLLLANPTQAIALLQALAGRKTGDTRRGADSSDPGQDSPSNPPVDLPSPDDAGFPPPPPPGWDDELDLGFPDDDPADHERPAEPSPDVSGAADGRARGEPAEEPAAQGVPTDGTGPPDSADAFLKPFFAPFRPNEVPPCACRGGGFLLDAAAMLPQVTLYLHGHLESVASGDGVVRWEGLGPITGEYLRNVLGPHARFTVKPVVDPDGMPPADAYEVPVAMAEALHLRTPFDVFPFAANTGRGKQKDHTVPYDFSELPVASGDHERRHERHDRRRERRRDRPRDGAQDTAGHHDGRAGASRDDRGRIRGQTGLHNLGGMTTFHHRVKTHGHWQVRQPFPGVYLWRSPHGSVFYVDNSGTRQLSGPMVSRRGPVTTSPETPSPGTTSPATESPRTGGPGEDGAHGSTFRTSLESVLHDESRAIAHFRRFLQAG